MGNTALVINRGEHPATPFTAGMLDRVGGRWRIFRNRRTSPTTSSRVSEILSWLADYVGADRPGKNRGSVTVDTGLQVPVSFWGGCKLAVRRSGAGIPV